ncbi:MAG: copper chaperone PCu(A)C [Burkholderiales bacterium]|nr:copper chaperone PCu(A)C [Burkholderiales bacterium]
MATTRRGAEVTARRRSAASVACALAAVLSSLACAQAAEIVLRHAWMRPAPAGAAAARAYVDIESDTDVDLVHATTPAATRVDIVRTTTIGDAATERVVSTYRVPARTSTRLAYRGDHLRLVDLRRDVRNGEAVPLVLEFRDAVGRLDAVLVEVSVRGLLLPQPAPGSGAATSPTR